MLVVYFGNVRYPAGSKARILLKLQTFVLFCAMDEMAQLCGGLNSLHVSDHFVLCNAITLGITKYFWKLKYQKGDF